jgi:glutamate-1-semialdehyde 2,1-aminomutase
VITGYRLALGGAQQRYGVRPDLTVLGKALGGGFPISAVCGRRDVMAVVADQRVSHVGTFNANPVCAAAALAAVTELERRADVHYPHLESTGTAFAQIMRAGAESAGLPLVVNQIGAAAYGFVSDHPVRSHEDALATRPADYRRFARALLEEGVHVIPRGLLYVSTAHTTADLDETRDAITKAAAAAAKELEAGDEC